MKHIIFEDSNEYPVAVLVKSSAFRKGPIETHYLEPAKSLGLLPSDVIAFDLEYQDNGKAPVSFIKTYLEHLLPVLREQGTKYLMVTDAAYYKVLSGNLKKSDLFFGYVTPCAIEGYEDMYVALGVNYQMLLHKPEYKTKNLRALETIVEHVSGTYEHPGADIIEKAVYPDNLNDIKAFLASLHKYDTITSDIEAFSLNAFQAGIGTISFGTSQSEGGAFACDYSPIPVNDGGYGEYIPNQAVRQEIKSFFESYKGKVIWHRSAYDLKVLIYTLWMKDPLDMVGLLQGLEVMTKNFGDSKLVAYLALNSASRQSYSLKALAQEFAGSWAIEDINDIRKIKLPKLLEYNLVDSLCTRYVHDKYYPVMVRDKQEDLYLNMFLGSQKTLLQVELCGMPMDIGKITELEKDLTDYVNTLLKTLASDPAIKDVELKLQHAEMEKSNAKLKTKKHPLSKFQDYKFNPNSVHHLQALLFDYMELPVLDYTDTGAPSTGGGTIKKLIHHTTDPNYISVLKTLLAYAQVEKIVSSFVPAFVAGTMKSDGTLWLHGSFNLGGTVSGRLSSSEPNLQNIPASSAYAKRIKEAFVAPAGWLFVGADFNSLEDYISALTTKDPNKLKVYLDGFDGHCLRAATYFAENMRDIEIAPDNADTYSAVVDGETIYFHSEEEIDYLGKTMTGKDLYDLLTRI